MIPLHLSLRNVRTFDELNLEIPEGLTALIGPNGAGKSSIVNAIEVALFGPESRTLADWYPRGGGTDPLVITLTFEHGADTYRVRRSYSPKGRGTSKTDLERATAGPKVSALSPMGEIPDADGMISHDRVAVWEPMTVESQAATQEQIEALIGITRETFRASSFLAQNEAGFFCEAPPRSRKAILADVVGIGAWNGWLERARTGKRAAESELDRIAGSLERAETELAERSLIESERAEAVEQRQVAEAGLQETLAALTRAREALAQAQADTERRSGAEKAVEQAERALSDLQVTVETRETEIKVIEVRLADREKLSELAEALPALEAERAALTEQAKNYEARQGLEYEHRRLTTEANIARQNAIDFQNKAMAVLAHEDEKCDRCGQALHAEAAQRAAESYRAEADTFAFRANNIEEHDLVTLNEKISALPSQAPDREREIEVEEGIVQGRSAEQRLAALAEAEKRREQVVRELEEMRTGLRGREEAVTTARAQLDALGPHDPVAIDAVRMGLATQKDYERIHRSQLSQLERAIAQSDAQLERLTKIAADVEAAVVRRDALHAEVDLLANMERACGPNGVPALILETVAIPQVETEATRILGLLGGPAYACELRTLREKKTGGLADTLDIVLLTETGEAPYESFSGGERARIAFALRLALAQLLASRKGSSTGLLVIDELAGLDARGVSALVTVLEELQRSIRSILVVSHDAEMRDSFEQTIMLEQVDGRSRLIDSLPLEVSA